MKVERSVDGIGGCQDGLGDNLASKDTYQIVSSPIRNGHTIHTRVAHLSFSEAANP